MTRDFAGLNEERERARRGFIRARFARDDAGRHLALVAADQSPSARSAWDAFSATQTEMDVMGDRLHLAFDAVIDHVLATA